MNPARRVYIAILGILVWIAGLIAAYYLIHKPVTPDIALGIGKAAWQIIVTFGAISFTGGLGRRILPLQSAPLLVRVALQAALGMGLICLAILAVGVSIGVNAFYAWLGMVVLAGMSWRQIIAWWLDWVGLTIIWRASNGFGRAVAILLTLLLASTLCTALAPPLKFDALVYHLSLPATYLKAGRIYYVAENAFWGMPQLGEMLYTWVIALAGLEAAAIFAWVAGLLALVGMLGFITSLLDTNSAWVALASLLSGHTLASALGWAYVDWLAILFGFGVLACLVYWRLEDRPLCLLLAGVYSGMALGTKYTAGVMLIAGSGAVFWHARKSPWVRSLAQYCLPAVWISMPWWIKNVLATGNPFYPFFFPAGAMTGLRLGFYDLPAWGGWQEVLFLPLSASIGGVEGAPGYSASIGPLLVSLAPFAWLGWRSRTAAGQVAVIMAGSIAVLGLAAWAVASRFSGLLIQSRLYFSFFPALALLAGAGYQGLNSLKLPAVRLGRVVGALILVVIGFSTLQVGMESIRQGNLRVLVEDYSIQDYLEENLGWYARAISAIQELPGKKKVLMLWEPRSLYCIPDCVADELLDRYIRDAWTSADPESILESWRLAGYTHLLYNRLGAGFVRNQDVRYSEGDWKLLDELLAQLPRGMEFGSAYSLYSLSP